MFKFKHIFKQKEERDDKFLRHMGLSKGIKLKEGRRIKVKVFTIQGVCRLHDEENESADSQNE